MISAVIAMALIGQQDTICPLRTKRPTTGVMAADYGGRRIFVCCDQCLKNITRNTDKIIDRSIKDGLLIGEFLFDPITHKRIVGKKAPYQTTHKSFKVYFATENDLKSFQAEPDKFWNHPKKEALTCPINGTPIKNLADTAGYKDVEGVRYYACSPDCFEKLETSDKVVENASNSVTSVAARPLPFPGGG